MPKNQAIFTVLLGAVFMSFAALGVRLIQNADGFQILTYRGISQCLMVGFVACATRHIRPRSFISSFDKTDWLIGVAMGIAFCFYIFALLNTSVASALFILSIAPIVASFFSWIFLHEPPSRKTLVAIALAMLGVAIMVGSGLTDGRTLGNVFAAISATAFAAMLVLARKSGKSDVLGGNFLGALLAMITAGSIAMLTNDSGLWVTQSDLIIMLLMGAFTIGLGIAFVAWAAPFLPAPEVSLLVLLESVLSPIWVWILLGESMSRNEMIGGGFILAAVIILTIRKPSKSF